MNLCFVSQQVAAMKKKEGNALASIIYQMVPQFVPCII